MGTDTSVGVSGTGGTPIDAESVSTTASSSPIDRQRVSLAGERVVYMITLLEEIVDQLRFSNAILKRGLHVRVDIDEIPEVSKHRGKNHHA